LALNRNASQRPNCNQKRQPGDDFTTAQRLDRGCVVPDQPQRAESGWCGWSRTTQPWTANYQMTTQVHATTRKWGWSEFHDVTEGVIRRTRIGAGGGDRADGDGVGVSALRIGGQGRDRVRMGAADA